MIKIIITVIAPNILNLSLKSMLNNLKKNRKINLNNSKKKNQNMIYR